MDQIFHQPIGGGRRGIAEPRAACHRRRISTRSPDAIFARGFRRGRFGSGEFP
jgi:hypothetical protein